MKTAVNSDLKKAGITLFPKPPENFEVRKATPKQLSKYGYPPRPDPQKSPEFSKAWDRMFARPVRRITPNLIIDQGGHHLSRRLERRGKGGFQAGSPIGPTNPAIGNPWAGAILNMTGTPMGQVLGYWNVPDVVKPNGISGFYNFGSAVWVGIDGNGTLDLIQAGTAQVINPSTFLGILFGDNTSYFAWFAWVPGPAVTISNLPVSPGDSIECWLWLINSTRCVGYMQNATQGIGTSLGFSAPSESAAALGLTAEWIVECPSEGSNVVYLPSIGDVFMNQCWAADQQFNAYSLQGAFTQTMTDVNGAAMATTQILNSTTLEVSYVQSE